MILRRLTSKYPYLSFGLRVAVCLGAALGLAAAVLPGMDRFGLWGGMAAGAASSAAIWRPRLAEEHTGEFLAHLVVGAVLGTVTGMFLSVLGHDATPWRALGCALTGAVAFAAIPFVAMFVGVVLAIFV